MEEDTKDNCIDMHWGLDSKKNSDLVMVFKHLGDRFSFVKYEAKHDTNGINEVSLSVTREKKTNWAPYVVMMVIGVTALILFFVTACASKKNPSPMVFNEKLYMEKNYGYR